MMEHFIKVISLFLVISLTQPKACFAQTDNNYESKWRSYLSLKQYHDDVGIEQNDSNDNVINSDSEKEASFECIDESELSCEIQAFIHRVQNRQPPMFFSNGKYRVSVFFVNDGGFPSKYINENSFKGLSIEEDLKRKNSVYEHFFKSDFEKYNLSC